ncbi:uncharacterized protein LOC126379847 isoform X2 [Pectinophora gossypiella]|uniref:uncharacterized protein LOC126379847 isoform X2 n=1 Tax=Pectinophora gossypiella TaxID=13191 RepID=UPI00214ECD62|nr:uncharacterized protein LOC126379847 isoform X2 [Pectinophora gossypiella]
MPGARSTSRPAPASELSASEEASQLELQLQRQLEEDVASDAYTECNINHQEREIISYLDDNLKIVKSLPNNTLSAKKEDTEEPDVFLTPKCVSPYVEKGFQKTISASPSTELTKEYYALVPIDGNLLEKELIEQDVLSNAFQSIIKSQTDDFNKFKVSQRNKPTSLSLSSSHISKTVKHSNSCDILNNHLKDTVCIKNSKSNDKIINTCTSHNIKNNKRNELTEKVEESAKKPNLETTIDKVIDSAYSPDSLITDDPSSSSDYLSAAYTCSPGVSSSGGHPQLNVGETSTNMDNIFTSSDSGLENTGLLESLSSHKDVTLTDISLTDCTLHDLTIDDTNTTDSGSCSIPDTNQLRRFKCVPQCTTGGSSSEREFNGLSNKSVKSKDSISCKSSKEEKQRQNEEIVILESSSLSSETGSWESVFPPKMPEKEICQKFICTERQFSNEGNLEHIDRDTSNYAENICPSLVQRSPFKSTGCFIDAASLVDEEDDTIKIQTDRNEVSGPARADTLPAPSQPVPCFTAKSDISPNDWSESNENDDSLEQADKKDTDSIQKDLSPTIFDMTPITEDSLSANTFENARAEESNRKTEEVDQLPSLQSFSSSSTVLMFSTPNNSILSLKTCFKQYELEESENDTTVGRESHANIKKSLKYNESSPIVSGGASIEDHLPQMASHSGSPLTRRKIENMPIVSGAYVPQVEEHNHRKMTKPSCAPAWVVDMSSSPKSDGDRSSPGVAHSKKPGDRTCDNLRNGSKSSLDSFSLDTCNKSRSSVDSDSSEKSHKFYIDLSSLPDPIPPKKNNECENSTEKKNIFSMYIDLGEKPTLKEMPARLSSSLNTRKSTTETKQLSKSCKIPKAPSTESTPAALSKPLDGHNSMCIFEKYESLCNDTELDITEIIHILEEEKNVPSKIEDNASTSDTVAKVVKHTRNVGADKSSQRYATTVIQEEPSSEPPADLFVKLSDLDKPVLKVDTSATVKEERIVDVRMTRSIPENNWGDQGNSGTSRSIDVISSFHSENALSLNRLFPHLKNEFSRSMPGSLSGRTRSPLRLIASSSPGDLEEQASDISEISSVQSSMCRSVVENSTTEETSQTSSLIGNCQSRLGQDLLRMFLQEIAPDVIVEVSGRRIKAHKCILSSRCQYFAGILSGGWVESAGNVIILPPFSFNVVHFALCHIYSGVSTIPDSISIVELATIADMLGLEGLKEAIMFTLKAKYCHHFHKPCQVCTAGVLECFPLSSVYGLDDLYRKCLRWITKYFSKVWPTKAFATLPKELLDKCYQQHIVNLTTDTLVDTVYGCGITAASLQNSRWAESVARMCRRLENAVAHFAALRLVGVLQALASLPPDPPRPAKRALDDCLSAAFEWAPPEETCRAYAFLSALPKQMRNQHYSKSDLITNGNQNKTTYQTLLYTHASTWRLQCEGALVRAAPRVVGTQAFKDLPADLRKRLRELGCIMYGAQALPVIVSPIQDRKSRSTYQQKGKVQNSSTTRSLDIDQVRASFVPYSSKPAVPIGAVDVVRSNNDLRVGKLRGNPPKIRTTKAQEERAKFNLAKNNQSQDRLNSKLASARMPYEKTKPRYLESKPTKEHEKRSVGGKKLAPKIVSSSESSRNSSPIQARQLRASRAKSRQAAECRAQAMSQDSLATSSRPRTAEPSTDSLSESQTSNKYATYTKTKHTTKGSIESVNSSKYPNASQMANNKGKTKIPVLYQVPRNNHVDKQEPQKRFAQTSKVAATVSTAAAQSRGRTGERKVPGSLMNATKSSSAKVVPKIVKESTKSVPKCSKRATGHAVNAGRHADQPEIPVMERSGTFLKDEPTFGDKTTNIDIDQ